MSLPPPFRLFGVNGEKPRLEVTYPKKDGGLSNHGTVKPLQKQTSQFLPFATSFSTRMVISAVGGIVSSGAVNEVGSLIVWTYTRIPE